MPDLIFYRQKRYDGAVRTGVELDGETIAERFEEGGAESDPALLWFVDLHCDGSGIPDDPDEARQWLLSQSDLIRDGFARLSERLKVGTDPDLYSVTWKDFEGVPGGVCMAIVCSAVRRVDARQMASNLVEIGENWESVIRSLDIPQEAEDIR